MLIQGAFMHVKDSVNAGTFLKFLAGEAPGGHYFVAQPPPGIIMTAAIDWRVIVPDGHADALATALWSGYESMVKPQGKEETDGCPSIFIQIKNVKGECDQFTMGKDIDMKDGFMHRVKESMAILSLKNVESAELLEIERTSLSDYWAQLA
jgi:hypothetical protein